VLVVQQKLVRGMVRQVQHQALLAQVFQLLQLVAVMAQVMRVQL
jgi:hypothetical protein